MKKIFEKWNVYKQSCTQSDGDQGSYVSKKQETGEIVSCHNSKEDAEASNRAKYASKNEEKLAEISAVGGVGGSLEGYVAPPKKKNKKKEEKLAEMFSSSTQTGGIRISIGGAEKEHAGHVERSKQQGLRNVMEDEEEPTGDSVVNDLIKFSKIAHIKRKRDSLWAEFLDLHGPAVLQKAILSDNTAQSRIEFMSSEMGENPDAMQKIKQGDQQALKDYYDFLMNEYLYWTYINPQSRPDLLADTSIKIGAAAKTLIRWHIHRYISDPNRNNPKSLSQRAIGKDSTSQKIYGDEATLGSTLYDLPE